MGWLRILLYAILLFFVIFLVSIKLYIKLRTRWCTSKVCLVGKTTVVTGANAGIGYETALEFAKRGARVILGCRDATRASEAREKIVKETLNKNVVVKLVDFTSLKSVRSFAESILETEEKLDILVNNAGVGSSIEKYSEDGLPMVMQINYFGPFLLTILLADLLKKSAPSRVVNVSSIMAARSNLTVDNLSKYAGSFYSYNNSKLGNVLFTMHLATILEKYNVTVYSLHPGAINTEIFRTLRGFAKHFVDVIRRIYFKTSEEGAQTQIYASIEQGIEKYTGCHFEECSKVSPYKTASDPELPKKFWNKTVELLKCNEEVKKLEA